MKLTIALLLKINSNMSNNLDAPNIKYVKLMKWTLNRINYKILYTNLHYFNVAVGQCERHQSNSIYFCKIIIAIVERFSIPVLAPPRSAYFVCYSYHFRCLFYSNVSALRSGHHRIFCHNSSSKRTYIFHSKCIEVCKT